ncbi:MAG: hypothetical protein KAG66_11415, partial [Methylococcales bacterium]|nr:hypothetical protein [Methylococcales bacterium]
IMDYLIDAATQREIDTIWLEVIKGNLPAYKMFKQYGFEETRELLVVRRPPNFTSDELPKIDSFIKEVELIQRDETLKLLYHRRKKPNWLNEAESMENVGRLEALMVRCSDGCGGWVSFDVGKFQLTRIVVEVIHGDPAFVTAAVLRALHRHYPTKDTMVENIATADPKWAGFQKLGYFDSFRRIEMVRRT